MIIPEIQNNFFSQVMNGVENVAQQKGYHVLVYLTHEDYTREKDILQFLRNGRVDGLMISVSNSTSDFDHLEAYHHASIPLVFFDRVCENINVPIITTDDGESSFKATTHLIQAGCRRIAFLSMSGNLSISNRRKAGYLRALESHGLEGHEQIIECGPDDDLNRQKIGCLLQSENAPDGIFATVEKFAINTYEVCQVSRINIPQQLKVISFSNLSAAALFDPPLSTIVQPAYEIGSEAAGILFRIIDKKIVFKAEMKKIIPSHLIIRASTTNKQYTTPPILL